MDGTRRRLALAVCLPLGMTAAWMLFDGTRALLLGDYVTPATGPYAGRLGPWADLLASLGLNPRATAVKAVHVLYGALTLAVAARFVAGRRALRPLVAAGVAGLWYLPAGTLLNAITLSLLSAPAVRRRLG